MNFARLAILLACLSFGFFATPYAGAQTPSKNAPIIKPFDNVYLTCQEEPSLSREYTVTRDGQLLLAFLGAFSVAGLTEAEAASRIAGQLVERRFLQRATVTLQIRGAKGQLITYSGAVKTAGELLPRPGLRLSDVVAAAEPTHAADLQRVVILAANGKEIEVDYAGFDGKDLSKNPEMRAGDRVVFPLARRTNDVSIVGHVARPGAIPFINNMTVASAIDEVGGALDVADLRQIRVDRDGRTMAVIDADQAKTFRIQPGDVVVVPERSEVEYVAVLGAVPSPMRVPFKDGMTLLQAIERSGGMLGMADQRRVTITRTVNGRRQVLRHNVEAIRLDKAVDPPLVAGDSIEVAFQGPGRRDNTLIQLGAAALIGILFGIGRR
jgi:protein involved in polysaccharide export with SLBB domain